MECRLSPTEIQIVKYISDLRYDINQSNGIREQKVGGDDPRKISAYGFLGEYAVCCMYNVSWNLASESRSRGHDCIINNLRVDVKTVWRPTHRNLVVKENFNPDIDAYILARITSKETVSVMGWAWAHEIIREENKRTVTNHGYFLHQTKLRSPESLRNAVIS